MHPLTPGDWARYHLTVDRVLVPEPSPWPLSLPTLEEAPALIPIPCVLVPLWMLGASASLKPTDCQAGLQALFSSMDLWGKIQRQKQTARYKTTKQLIFFCLGKQYFSLLSLSLPLTILLLISVCMYEIFS